MFIYKMSLVKVMDVLFRDRNNEEKTEENKRFEAVIGKILSSSIHFSIRL